MALQKKRDFNDNERRLIVAYAPLITREGLTRREIEERLHEAIRTLQALPDRERKWVYARMASWPETLREKVDLIALAFERIKQNKSAFEGLREPPYIPTKDAIDRLDNTLKWLTLLDERENEILRARANKVSWIKIAWRYGRSDTTVQRWYGDAILTIWYVVGA